MYILKGYTICQKKKKMKKFEKKKKMHTNLAKNNGFLLKAYRRLQNLLVLKNQHPVSLNIIPALILQSQPFFNLPGSISIVPHS